MNFATEVGKYLWKLLCLDIKIVSGGHDSSNVYLTNAGTFLNVPALPGKINRGKGL